MKKQMILLAACVLAGAAAADATCWRINPSPFAKAQFKTVEEAMADINVASGDTLLLDPGSYGNVDVTSRDNITIIGPGYFLDKNKQWAESQNAVMYIVSLDSGSKIEGCIASDIRLNGYCTASRCKAGDIASNYSNNTIECCIAERIFPYGTQQSQNNIIRNNIITSISNQDGSIIENNVIVGESEPISWVRNSTVKNNIIINTKSGFDSNQIPFSCSIYYGNSDSFTNNVIQNNVFSVPERYIDSNDMFKDYPNNYYVGATVANTFVNEGSDDGKWQLLSTSAAKGAATHGGDCGAFGGATPYVLSGIPMFLPHITEAFVPVKPTDGKITVKLKIENQNE